MPVKISELTQVSSTLNLSTKFEIEDNSGDSYYATLTQISGQLDIPDSTSDLVNDSGFITGITSGDITTALGYTPQNAATAFSGDYNDLSNKPSIPAALADLSNVSATSPGNGEVLKFNGTEWAPATDISGSGNVDSIFGRTGVITAASGDYAASQITNDSTATGATVSAVLDSFDTSIAAKANTASLASVATSGSYTDLSDTPTIPTNNTQLTNGAGYITELSDDTTPQLGGNLDGQNNSVHNILSEIDDITGTSYTLVNGDSGKIKRTTNASVVTITVPNTLPVGFFCEIIQKGAGTISFSGTATINNRQSHSDTAGQYAVVSLRCDVSGEVILAGDTA